MKIGVCKLCGLEKELIKAHVIPEYLYSGLYDDNHKIKSVQIQKRVVRTEIEQKGIRDQYILCQKCDNEILNERYDKYGKSFFSVKQDDLAVDWYHDKNDPRVKWSVRSNVDGGRLKLFFLSILWRSHISTHKYFSEVDLGSNHENKIRKMIIENNPGGKDDYPVVLLNYSVKNEMARKVISGIHKYKRDGGTYYAGLMGGSLVLWHISTHSIPKIFDHCCIKDENKVMLLESPQQGFDFLKNFSGLKH